MSIDQITEDDFKGIEENRHKTIEKMTTQAIAKRNADDKRNHDLGGDRLIEDIKKVATAQASNLPIYYTSKLLWDLLERGQDFIRKDVHGVFNNAVGAQATVTYTYDRKQYIIVVVPVKEGK